MIEKLYIDKSGGNFTQNDMALIIDSVNISNFLTKYNFSKAMENQFPLELACGRDTSNAYISSYGLPFSSYGLPSASKHRLSFVVVLRSGLSTNDADSIKNTIQIFYHDNFALHHGNNGLKLSKTINGNEIIFTLEDTQHNNPFSSMFYLHSSLYFKYYVPSQNSWLMKMFAGPTRENVPESITDYSDMSKPIVKFVVSEEDDLIYAFITNLSNVMNKIDFVINRINISTTPICGEICGRFMAREILVSKNGFKHVVSTSLSKALVVCTTQNTTKIELRLSFAFNDEVKAEYFKFDLKDYIK